MFTTARAPHHRPAALAQLLVTAVLLLAGAEHHHHTELEATEVAPGWTVTRTALHDVTAPAFAL